MAKSFEIEPEHQHARTQIETVLRSLDDSEGWLVSYVTGQVLGQRKSTKGFPVAVERVNCLETALRLRPDEESVFESLETIYTETGSWQKLVDLLKARLRVENGRRSWRH